MNAFSDVATLVAIILGTVNIGASAAVVWNYWRALRSLQRERGFRPQYGLLVWHVVCIASAWSGMWMLLVTALLEIRGVLILPRPVRLTGYVLVGGVGIAALVLIAMETRRRVQRPPTSTTVVESTATVVHGDEPPTAA